eukprot:gnl/Trimastix_PCT/2839.p1 GENE.gnl/Trimastix_PCT/2839~~gnl/Trimastix_PCT/2839.p1  ORF type:complete len:124 (-),score=7.12 gnl/Trimastix_PCT/2839:100-471(-)
MTPQSSVPKQVHLLAGFLIERLDFHVYLYILKGIRCYKPFHVRSPTSCAPASEAACRRDEEAFSGSSVRGPRFGMPPVTNLDLGQFHVIRRGCAVEPTPPSSSSSRATASCGALCCSATWTKA